MALNKMKKKSIRHANGSNPLPTGENVMYSGDTNLDNIIDAQDRSTLWNARNQVGYLPEDITLNGYCGADDRSHAWNNRNIASQVP